ncbi:hypothetical protein KAJ71_07065 [Serratia sp. arafor3]|uniref:Uncharacterized protein n=2 Tax=Serratia silvae TaxID=2824122 RepID=A0ABT0K9S5_9GAMM|nr:hypothetical protein [Serratia silvae]
MQPLNSAGASTFIRALDLAGHKNEPTDLASRLKSSGNAPEKPLCQGNEKTLRECMAGSLERAKSGPIVYRGADSKAELAKLIDVLPNKEKLKTQLLTNSLETLFGSGGNKGITSQKTKSGEEYLKQINSAKAESAKDGVGNMAIALANLYKHHAGDEGVKSTVVGFSERLAKLLDKDPQLDVDSRFAKSEIRDNPVNQLKKEMANFADSLGGFCIDKDIADVIAGEAKKNNINIDVNTALHGDIFKKDMKSLQGQLDIISTHTNQCPFTKWADTFGAQLSAIELLKNTTIDVDGNNARAPDAVVPQPAVPEALPAAVHYGAPAVLPQGQPSNPLSGNPVNSNHQVFNPVNNVNVSVDFTKLTDAVDRLSGIMAERMTAVTNVDTSGKAQHTQPAEQVKTSAASPLQSVIAPVVERQNPVSEPTDASRLEGIPEGRPDVMAETVSRLERSIQPQLMASHEQVHTQSPARSHAINTTPFNGNSLRSGDSLSVVGKDTAASLEGQDTVKADTPRSLEERLRTTFVGSVGSFSQRSGNFSRSNSVSTADLLVNEKPATLRRSVSAPDLRSLSRGTQFVTDVVDSSVGLAGRKNALNTAGNMKANDNKGMNTARPETMAGWSRSIDAEGKTHWSVAAKSPLSAGDLQPTGNDRLQTQDISNRSAATGKYNLTKVVTSAPDFRQESDAKAIDDNREMPDFWQKSNAKVIDDNREASEVAGNTAPDESRTKGGWSRSSQGGWTKSTADATVIGSVGSAGQKVWN